MREETNDQKCPTCNGTGRNPLSDNVCWLPCQVCRGTGLAQIKPAIVNATEEDNP